MHVLVYDANREVYGLLRYGVKVRPELGEQTETVWLVDWTHPDNNDFGVAEEVTVLGVNTKRPDLVLYVNGIAVAVLELKRSIVAVTEGIRQNLDSQRKEFIQPFYTTVQLIVERGEGALEALPKGLHEDREAMGRDHREQRPAADHRRDGRQPEVLREDVGAARRPDHPASAGGAGLQGLPGPDCRTCEESQ